ncbi:MAG: GTP pyrophosphokinase family protein [Clostridiales bacterium]|nr:GTP pyrophosphokinase family protein [Clostridiales bacterium]
MYEALMTEEMKPWRDLLLVHKFAVEEIKTKLDILDEEFRNIHDYNPIEHIRYRVKKPNNIIKKLDRMGFEPTIENARMHISDIAGIRIICSFTNDIYHVAELLEKQDDLKVVLIKDYIKEPKANGYKSLHMHIDIPVYLSSGVVPTRIEVQIRTVAMDFWASLEHKIYYKFRNKAPSKITEQLKICANMISILDERMLDIKNEIGSLDLEDETLTKDVISEIELSDDSESME